MKTLATVFTIPMCLGLAMAQDTTTTPQATGSTANMASNGQSWYGILVDSKCNSSGMASGTSGNMPRSSAMSKATSGSSDSLMNRTSPAQSGRDVNTTDRNTSGVADRIGATSGNTAGARDMNRTSNSSDMNRGTATDRGTSADMDRNSADRRASDIARGTSTDMARSTNAASSGSATDTQSGSNANPHAVGDVAANNHSGNWDRSCFISPSSSSFVLQLQDGRTMKIDDAGNSRISSQLQSTGRVSSKNKVFRVRVTGSADGDTLHVTDIQM